MSERIISWVTLEELRRITGKDRRTISDRIAGLPFEKKGRSKLYDKTVALQAIMAGGAGAMDESKAKERKSIAEAEKIELIVSKMKGDLVPVADMKTAAAELIKTLYQRIVRVTPAIVAPKLIGRTDVLDIEAIIRDALAEDFNELKNMPEKFLTIEPTDEDEEDDSEPTE
jgi:hypothetical protein